jgi:EAL domain-containing protein (putative c-di-GMP-specific phosphodiesterase class I)
MSRDGTLRKSRRPVGPAVVASGAPADASRARLLILDDDASIGRMIQLIAEGASVEARFLTGTTEFFRVVEEWCPTHIALDLVMPEMDGVEVLVQLAAQRCTAKIIITSGVGTRVLDAAGRSANEHGLTIAGVLSKPFSPSMLRRLLVDAADTGSGGAGAVRPHASGQPAEDLAVSAADLERALENREFVLAYQPQIQCVGGRIAGFEALVRWAHPRRGLIGPDRFIPCAEANGLIEALTHHVMETAIGWFAPRFAETDVTLAVNLSPRGTSVAGGPRADGECSLVDRITAHCRAGGMRRERMILELTETSAMEDPVASLDLLTRLRMKGFQLSIDDFGTGYSSMLQLVRLPFSEIKIDKSFVMTATRSTESRVVVESIINLGHSLGLRVVAEGVEDAATLAYLRAAGCDLAQGYFIAVPMPAADLGRWLDRDARSWQMDGAQRPLL